MSLNRLHLSIVGQDPISEGPRGCDYAWLKDFVGYRCLPHQWVPGSDWSYAAFQARDVEGDDSPLNTAATEGDLYGDNALDGES